MGRVGPEELTEVVAIARRHYVDGVSRVDIATERGLSRFKVGRVLQAARAAGMLCTMASAEATSARETDWPCGVLRSQSTERFPRLSA